MALPRPISNLNNKHQLTNHALFLESANYLYIVTITTYVILKGPYS